ncbi:pentatricopeptide repeat-containing protein At3g06430, chloroplastic-like [Phragmites australis]|uniref:pentatricopeptide repeat-containing protein At3g06430, chloroplastic-like n=1 Tax=Phragmites australis TaxID=29695 RepID=UPI002D7A3A38|nr:pentatricopeptide repeat-containing protein At3g06430, chloroplastic-like [Phragmites australis]
MAIAAARRRLCRGIGTAAVSGTDGTLLARLVSEPECRVKATMEEAASSAPHRDGAFWEPLAAALLRASSPAKAHLVLEWKLDKLLKEGSHDCEPYSTIIRLCGETRNAALAMRVFESMEAQEIQLNTGILNALVNAFLSIRDLLSAMTLYEAMEGMEDCKPDSTTYGAFISAFSLLGSGHAMMSWYLAAKNAGFTLSIQAFESLITGFVRLNMLDEAETVFEEMISFEIKPNLAILEAKLQVLSRRKEANMVRDFLKYVIDGNWELNEATVERLTRLCLDGGQVDEMEQLLALVQKGVHLSSVAQLHCGIIKFYAKADRLADMEHAICRMLDNCVMFVCPEDVEVIICSYFRHKDFDRLDLFLHRIQCLFKLTRSTYDILVAGYRRFDLHERLDSTIKDMREAGFA